MTIGFDRPSGAAADVKELEYIVALHQTCFPLRKDGSITDDDIVLFLLSRYGIDVTAEEVRTQVIRGLGGGDEEQDDCIDLCETVCMLLIPTLLKACMDEAELPKGVVRPRPGLVNYVLSMILHDTTGSHVPKKLDKQLIQKILISYGEADLARNNDLVEEMLESAQTPEGILNLEAFSNGLTHDVKLYDVANETSVSTNYDDVFLTKNHRDDWNEEENAQVDIEGADQRQSVLQERKKMSRNLNTRFTAPAIDMIVDTFRSKTVTALLWATYIITAFAYQGFGGDNVDEFCIEEASEFKYGQGWKTSLKPMGCEVGRSVASWLATFIAASLYGMMFIGCGSIGNKITCRRWFLPFLGMAFAVCFTLGPYLDETVFESKGASYLPVVSVILGFIVGAFHLFHMLTLVTPKRWVENMPHVFQYLFTAGVVRAESHIKQSAAHKVSGMLDNALDLASDKDRDSVLETHFGQSLLAYEKQGKTFVHSGGFAWTWKRIFNLSLFRDEGIWLSARLIASNAAQFIVSIFVLIAGIQICQRIEENYDIEEARRQVGAYVDLLFNTSVADEITAGMVSEFSLIMREYLLVSGLNDTCEAGNFTDISDACNFVSTYVSCESNETSDALCTLLAYPDSQSFADGLTSLGLLDAAGFDASSLVNTSQAYLSAAAEASVNSLYPNQKYMVKAPAIIGTIAAFITAISLAVTYIPSVTSTTLKLRYGVIPSLKSPSFTRYRFAADQVTVLTGSMFWGCLIASILLGGLVGALLFIFLWQATISFTQRLVAIVIGIGLVILLKLALVTCCRQSYYKAFYRRRPAAANISALALECTNFSLSVGFVFLRMCKLIVTAALFVGRIDTPFLAPGVGQFGPVEIDNYPNVFLKDILGHEAHRHPYIELLGVIYLMKLRYGNHFGQRAGTTWRLIFVSALFPWFNKYRVLARDTATVNDFEVEEVQNGGFREAFESVRPSARQDATSEPPPPRSDLMTKFQSLRSSFKNLDDAAPESLNKPSTQRRHSTRTSTRGSLLANELDGAQQGELQRKIAELELKLIGLESENHELQAENEQLRQDLGRRKTKRFHTANHTDDLHKMARRSSSLGDSSGSQHHKC